MPHTKNFPFRRLAVDHLIKGNTRVWWQLNPLFRPTLPCHFQLQHSHSGIDQATDWVDVGNRVTDAFYAVDDSQRLYGNVIESFYRVTLTVGAAQYVSEAAGAFGELTDHDWVIAREIIRKERLRGRLFSHVDGFLLKRMGYGAPCPRCRDPLTNETTDSDCPICNGTGRRIGYHPAVPMCLEKSNEQINETTDPQMRGPINDQEITGRVLAFPMAQKGDIWVDGQTDQRWTVDKVQQLAVRRSMPLVLGLSLKLLPFTDPVYKLGLCGGTTEAELPDAGAGCVTVDHDYGEVDAYRYLTAADEPIVGGDVLAFTIDVYDDNRGQPPDSLATAATTTGADGRWTSPLRLNPGQYVLILRHASYGASPTDLLVERPATDSSSSSSFWDV